MEKAKIVIFENENFKLSPQIGALWAKFAEVECITGHVNLKTMLMTPDQDHITAIFIPGDLDRDQEIVDAIRQGSNFANVVWVDASGYEPAPNKATVRINRANMVNATMVKHVCDSLDKDRTPGVRAFLEPGAVIYTENFFRPDGVGALLDPSFLYVKNRLGVNQALRSWSVINTMIFEAFDSVITKHGPDHRERIKLQVGTDFEKICVSLTYPKDYKDTQEIFDQLTVGKGKVNNAWLVVRQNCNYFEINAYTVEGTIEMVAVFDKMNSSQATEHPAVVREISAVQMEKMDEASSYRFRPFKHIADAIDEKEVEQMKAAGKKPKKKFSDRMAQIVKNPGSTKEQETVVKGGAADDGGGEVAVKGAKAASEDATKVEGTTEHQNDGSTTVKGDGADAGGSTTIKGTTEHMGDDAVVVELKFNDADVKKVFDLESIKKDPDTAKQATMLEARLNDALQIVQEREVKIKQLAKVQKELEEAENREKKLMSMVDKAVQIKDDAMKKLKSSETKLRQLQEAKDSQAAQYEKKIEELNKQKDELASELNKAA